jgi:hypothetical protein
MVERFNGRIVDMLKTNWFNSREDMEQTLLRYVALYNHQLPQSALGSKTPMQAMKNWYQEHPHLFHKRPYDRPGCDTYSRSWFYSSHTTPVSRTSTNRLALNPSGYIVILPCAWPCS